MRTFFPQAAFYASPGLYIADPRVGHRMRPGLRSVVTNRAEFTTRVRINSLGIRGPEYGAHRQGVLRVLVLGDSFTFGTGVEEEEAFPARLAAELTRDGIPAEGINAGIGGYGVPDEVTWFETYGTVLHPDLIVLGIFLGNDLQDAAPDRAPTFVVNGDILDQAELHRSAFFHWMFRHSQLFALVKLSLPAPVDRTLRRALHMPEPGAIRGLREEMAVYTSGNLPAEELGGKGSEAALRRLLALEARGHIPVAALLLPSVLQTDDRLWSSTLHQLALAPAQVDRRLPNEVFAQVLAHCGVPTLDLTPVFAQAIRHGGVLYFPKDQHFTVAGHRQVAEAAAAFLRRVELLPAPGYPHPPTSRATAVHSP